MHEADEAAADWRTFCYAHLPMCGLGAILRTDGGPIDPAWIERLDTRIAPRGPDGSGCVVLSGHEDPGGGPVVQAALVHRRLSILDPAGGAQPMCLSPGGGDPEFAVVNNGCIYNHRDLRQQLEAAGHVFGSDHSDTEVLLHGYREWGDQLTAHLEGMYAFVIWDRAKGALVMGRDWFGEKPLWIGGVETDGGGIAVVSSDAAAVAAVQSMITGRAQVVDPEWLRGMLRFGYGRSGVTPYGGDGGQAGPVRAHPIGLPPDIGEEDQVQRWRIDSDPGAFEKEVETALDTAVARRLESDVPLGCFLSGGVDSSLVAAFARRHLDLATFSVRMPDPENDETEFALRAAKTLGTRHTVLDCDPHPADDLRLLIDRLGQPFGDSSLLPTYWVSRAAAQHVTVALGGDGGDELFFGYDRYRGASVLMQYRGLLRWLPASFGATAPPRSMKHRLGRLGAMSRDWSSAGLLAMESIFDARQLDALLGPDGYGGSDPGPVGRRFMDTDAGGALRFLDLSGYLPGDLMTKVDTASMACPIEVRSPMLDRDLVRLMVGAHPNQIRRDRRKGLLRDIALRHLPRDIVERPKMGFAIPVGRWFRDPEHELHDLLHDSFASESPFGGLEIDPSAARKMLDEHQSGAARHDQRLFCLLTVALWAHSPAGHLCRQP